jgi:hypothetical protein
MLRCVLVLMSVMSTLSPAQGNAQGIIGIYADDFASCHSDHSSCYCCAESPPFVETTFYILARPEQWGPPLGIRGAEFRVAGQPSGLLLVSIPNAAANIVLGDPFSDETQPVGSRGGVSIAWPECQVPDGYGFLVLLTVVVTNIGNVTDVFLEVEAKDPPTNLNFSCPLLTACDLPVFTAHCVIGDRLHLNPKASPVESKLWGEVTGLYQ